MVQSPRRRFRGNRTGFPAAKTDALPVEFRSVAADSFQSFGCAQLAAFHELNSNALDGAPHSGSRKIA